MKLQLNRYPVMFTLLQCWLNVKLRDTSACSGANEYELEGLNVALSNFWLVS